MFTIWLTNLYLILKSLVFATIGQLYNDKHLPQYRFSLLPPGLSYFPNRFLHIFNSFYILLDV